MLLFLALVVFRQRPLVLGVTLLAPGLPRFLRVPALPRPGEGLADDVRVASGGQEDRPNGGEKAAA